MEEESTRTVKAGLREVIEQKGCFGALYRDRASHCFETPRAGGRVDSHRLTPGGGALKELGMQMLPAYSPPARGRSERRWAGITGVKEAHRFLRAPYLGEMKRKFSVPATQPGDALVPVRGQDGDRIFSVQHQRVVAKDKPRRLAERTGQMERRRWRGTRAGWRATIGEPWEGRVSIL